MEFWKNLDNKNSREISTHPFLRESIFRKAPAAKLAVLIIEPKQFRQLFTFFSSTLTFLQVASCEFQYFKFKILVSNL